MLKIFILCFLTITLLTSCVDKSETNILLDDIQYLSLMDAFELNDDVNDLIQDTVFYHFGIHREMMKIRFDYEEENGKVILSRIDSVKIEYFLDGNSLFMHRHPDDQLRNIPTFGKDNAEWVITKLTADTMIVDAYLDYGKYGRNYFGHWGFSVQ